MKTMIFSYDLFLFIMPVSFTSVMQIHIAKDIKGAYRSRKSNKDITMT